VALQATPEQIAQFRRSSTSTQLAQKRAQDLLQLSTAGTQPDLSHRADILANAVEEAQADNEKFVLSFSKEQQEALKKLAKKLRKSDSEVANQTKALSQGLDRRGLTDKQISAILEKLDKALGEFQSEQLAIGSEMGIQGHGNLSN
jgi:predicted transcriptional regulator